MSEDLLKNTEGEPTPEAVNETPEVAAETPETVQETQEVVAETPEVEAKPEEVESTNEVVAEELPEVEKPAAERPKKVFESAYPSLDEFSWDSIEKKGSRYSAEEQERYQELYTRSFKSVDENEVITGTVVSINSREVVVNIGFKSDGVISANELRYNPDLKVGDEIEVYVENQEDALGQLQLSH